MIREDWQHLADRLKTLEFGCSAQTLELLGKILALPEDKLDDPALERAGCAFVGQELCRVLDMADHDPSHEAALKALEVEMLGRTLNHSLLKGWLVRSKTCPDVFPSIDEFL